MKGLEIGGERTPAYPDYDQVDNVPDFGATIVDDAMQLATIVNETYDHVYARNVLEHFSWRDTKYVIKNWLRVTKVGGILDIIVPDTIGILNDYQNGIDSWPHTCKRLAGSQDYPGNTHKAFFTFDEFEHVVPDNYDFELTQTHSGGGITVRIYK